VAGLVLVLLSFTGGVWADQNFPDIVPVLPGQSGPGQFDQASVNQAQRLLRTQYYNDKLDSGSLSQGSIRGMVQALGDPYSAYLDPAQYRQQQDSYSGRHAGLIGIYVDYQDGYPVITGLLPASPALKAGLKTGDVILAIDGKPALNLKPEESSALIRGRVGTQVALHLRRGGGELDVTVERQDFQSPSVEAASLPGSVLYLRVYQFGDRTREEFDSQLAAGLPAAHSVVLDLRENGGGLVSAAVAMVSRFVERGEVFEERGRNGSVQRTDVDGNHPAAAVRLFVLVNEDSASASEIVSGSLQAHHRGALVGAKTFGKGSVQVDYRLQNGGDLHLTIARWYLPDGRSIDKSGLQPDVSVALAKKSAMFDVLQLERGHADDAQLNEALQLASSP